MSTEKSIQRAAIVITIISALIMPFMGAAVNIVLPTIGKEFHMNAVEMSWVITAFLVTSAVFLLPFGRLSDIIGRKKVFIIGITCYAACTMSIVFIPENARLLIVLRGLQGLSASMIFVTGMTILISVFPPTKRGMVLGINTACIYLGLSIGPFVGGLLAKHFSWRSVFLVTAIMAMFLIFYVPLKLKNEWADAKGEKFDFAGSFIYCLSLIALMMGFSALPKIFGFALICAGVVLFLLFLKYENKLKFPVMNIEIFKKSRTFTLATVSALINYCATFGVAFLVSLYLQNVKGFDSFHAGTIMLVQPVMQTVFSPLAGKMSDKKDPQTIASIGMGITAAALTMLVFVTENTTLPYVIASLGLLGIGFGVFSSPNTTAAMNAADKRYYGVASSLVATMRLMGQMLSMGIAMIVFTLIMKDALVTTENIDIFIRSMEIILAIFAVLCFLGIFLKTRKNEYVAKIKS